MINQANTSTYVQITCRDEVDGLQVSKIVEIHTIKNSAPVFQSKFSKLTIITLTLLHSWYGYVTHVIGFYEHIAIGK